MNFGTKNHRKISINSINTVLLRSLSYSFLEDDKVAFFLNSLYAKSKIRLYENQHSYFELSEVALVIKLY